MPNARPSTRHERRRRSGGGESQGKRRKLIKTSAFRRQKKALKTTKWTVIINFWFLQGKILCVFRLRLFIGLFARTSSPHLNRCKLNFNWCWCGCLMDFFTLRLMVSRKEDFNEWNKVNAKVKSRNRVKDRDGGATWRGNYEENFSDDELFLSFSWLTFCKWTSQRPQPSHLVSSVQFFKMKASVMVFRPLCFIASINQAESLEMLSLFTD